MRRANRVVHAGIAVASSILMILVIAYDVGGVQALTSVRDLLLITVVWIITVGVVVLFHVSGPVLTGRAGSAPDEDDPATDAESENEA